MSCARCKSPAPEGVRFCPACGAEILVSPDIDPLAATALANPEELRKVRDAAVAAAKSAAPAGASPTGDKRSIPRTVPLQRMSSAGPAPKPRGPAEIPAIPPPQFNVTAPMSQLPGSVPSGFSPGARTLVRWSDGRQYPGVIEETQGGRALVAFPDGQRHWVAFSLLTLASR